MMAWVNRKSFGRDNGHTDVLERLKMVRMDKDCFSDHSFENVRLKFESFALLLFLIME